MRKKILKILSFILSICMILCTVFLIACATTLQPEFEKSGITVTLMNGEHYHVNGANKVKVNDGEAVFTVTVDKGYIVTGSFGDKCEINTKSRSLKEVKFKDIEYSCVVQLETKETPKTDQVYSINYYLGNSDPIYQDCTALLAHHPKANTLTERYLREQGYITDETDKMLVGWETEDGKYIGLGSRAEVSGEGSVLLSAVWKDYSETALFTVQDGKIIDYIGNEEEVVIPRKINGNDITTICANAFENCKAKRFYIPSSVTTIESEAFKNCETMTDFYMSDNIIEISDMSFCGCKNFTTLHVNAILDPVYIEIDDATKADVLDRLEMCDGKKLVVTGGSSVTYGYNISKMQEITEGYYGFNLGLVASLNATFWYDMISDFLNEGDVYLHAPELSGIAINTQYGESCLTNNTANQLCFLAFQMLESNWDLLNNLTVNCYCNLFDYFNMFNNNRLTALSESSQHLSYESYNVWCDIYGSITSWRDNCGFTNYAFNGNGRFNFVDNVKDEDFIGAGESIYKPLAKKGVKVFLMFPPLNNSNLLMSYPTQNAIEEACAEYTNRVKTILQNYPVTVLLSQIDSVYLSETFCNSDYHLGYTQSLVHTQKVMQALKPYLEELN